MVMKQITMGHGLSSKIPFLCKGKKYCAQAVYLVHKCINPLVVVTPASSTLIVLELLNYRIGSS